MNRGRVRCRERIEALRSTGSRSGCQSITSVTGKKEDISAARPHNAFGDKTTVPGPCFTLKGI